MINTKNENVRPVNIIKDVIDVMLVDGRNCTINITNPKVYKCLYFQNMYKKSVTIKVLCNCKMVDMQKIGEKYSAVSVRKGMGGYIFEFKK